MNKITYGAITLLIPEGNLGYLSNETFTINLSGSKGSGNGHRKERAEIVSGIKYTDIIELGESEQLELLENMGNDYSFKSFKRRGKVRVV